MSTDTCTQLRNLGDDLRRDSAPITMGEIVGSDDLTSSAVLPIHTSRRSETPTTFVRAGMLIAAAAAAIVGLVVITGRPDADPVSDQAAPTVLPEVESTEPIVESVPVPVPAETDAEVVDEELPPVTTIARTYLAHQAEWTQAGERFAREKAEALETFGYDEEQMAAGINDNYLSKPVDVTAAGRYMFEFPVPDDYTDTGGTVILPDDARYNYDYGTVELVKTEAGQSMMIELYLSENRSTFQPYPALTAWYV